MPGAALVLALAHAQAVVGLVDGGGRIQGERRTDHFAGIFPGHQVGHPVALLQSQHALAGLQWHADGPVEFGPKGLQAPLWRLCTLPAQRLEHGGVGGDQPALAVGRQHRVLQVVQHPVDLRMPAALQLPDPGQIEPVFKPLADAVQRVGQDALQPQFAGQFEDQA